MRKGTWPVFTLLLPCLLNFAHSSSLSQPRPILISAALSRPANGTPMVVIARTPCSRLVTNNSPNQASSRIDRTYSNTSFPVLGYSYPSPPSFYKYLNEFLDCYLLRSYAPSTGFLHLLGHRSTVLDEIILKRLSLTSTSETFKLQAPGTLAVARAV